MFKQWMFKQWQSTETQKFPTLMKLKQWTAAEATTFPVAEAQKRNKKKKNKKKKNKKNKKKTKKKTRLNHEAEAVYTIPQLLQKLRFPNGLVKLPIQPVGENPTVQVSTKHEQDRINYLLKNTYGAPEGKTKQELATLLSEVYYPYLQRCCVKKQPLVYTLPISKIQLAHGGISSSDKEVNASLNKLYCDFIDKNGHTVEACPRKDLYEAGLLGHYYTGEFSNLITVKSQRLQEKSQRLQESAREIQKFVNIADVPAKHTITALTGVSPAQQGPIWTHFWELGNTERDDVLLGICGHTPTGKLPMVFQNNMCCDTTYALGTSEDAKRNRPAMSIKATLSSLAKWRFDVNLKEPIDIDGGTIQNYYITNDIMQKYKPPDGVEKKHQHFVGRTSTNGDVLYNIWRLTKSEHDPSFFKFWRSTPSYMLEKVEATEEATEEATGEATEGEDKYYIITDVEGNKRFFDDCLEMINKDTPLIVLGDMWDRGTAEDETDIWHALEGLENAITIVGNRDANKMRWWGELNNWVPNLNL